MSTGVAARCDLMNGVIMKRNDLSGSRFGMLLVSKDAGNDAYGNSMWLCQCDCGNTKVIRGSKLKSGDAKSCWCAQHIFTEERCKNISRSKIKHGLSGDRLYYIYDNMMKRCYSETSEKYPLYGGRGITVCEEWRNNRNAFFEWALLNGYDADLTIDRIDVNGNYCPENCRWSTQKEQANNMTNNHFLSHQGETHSIAEWAEITGIPASTLYARISKGWDPDIALSTPV